MVWLAGGKGRQWDWDAEKWEEVICSYKPHTQTSHKSLRAMVLSVGQKLLRCSLGVVFLLLSKYCSQCNHTIYKSGWGWNIIYSYTLLLPTTKTDIDTWISLNRPWADSLWIPNHSKYIRYLPCGLYTGDLSRLLKDYNWELEKVMVSVQELSFPSVQLKPFIYFFHVKILTQVSIVHDLFIAIYLRFWVPLTYYDSFLLGLCLWLTWNLFIS